MDPVAPIPSAINTDEWQFLFLPIGWDSRCTYVEAATQHTCSLVGRMDFTLLSPGYFTHNSVTAVKHRQKS